MGYMEKCIEGYKQTRFILILTNLIKMVNIKINKLRCTVSKTSKTKSN